MNADEELALRKLHSNLVRALYVDDDFIDTLYAKQLFTDNHIYKIRAKETPRDKARELLLTLRRRGPTAFALFLEALEENDRTNIAEALRMKLRGIREQKNATAGSIRVAVDERDAAEQPLPLQYQQLLPSDCRNAPLIHDSELYLISPVAPGGFHGQVILINNVRFSDHEERDGSDEDAQQLCKFFADANLRVHLVKNLKCREMESAIKNFLNDEELHGPNIDPKAGDCPQVHLTIICLLSHGKDGAVFGTDDVGLSVDSIIDCLTAPRCPLLAGKPKWLFIQAYRGDKHEILKFSAADSQIRSQNASDAVNDAICVSSSTSESANAEPVLTPIDAVVSDPVRISESMRPSYHSEFVSASLDSKYLHAVPAMSDILVSYATCSKYVAWRSKLNGSWYIQDFITTLRGAAGEKNTGLPRWQALDVLTLLTLTNNRVTQRQTSARAVQTCEFQSRLRKVLYFKPEARIHRN